MLRPVMMMFVSIFSLFGATYCLADCSSIDKHKLASVMNIESSLVPMMSLEIPACENIELRDEYAGFVLNEQNKQINNGIRSEIAIDFPFQEGDVVEYCWSIRLPVVGAPGAGEKDWWVIAQWHDQPDPRRNETWVKFPQNSPPVAIFVERRDGLIGIGLQGIKGRNAEWSPAPTDEWLKLRVVIRWTTQESGQVQVTVDGHPTITLESNGRTMRNHYQHYFKGGQYRSPAINQYAVVYMKDLRFRKL